MKRLDLLISGKYEISRSFATRLIKSEKIFLKEIPITDPSKLFSGDSLLDITVTPGALDTIEPDDTIIPQDIPLEILYEDDHVLVIYKKEGISVHTSASERSGTIINALAFRGNNTGVQRYGIVHRLDKQTSGALIIAKDPITQDMLSRQFQDRTVYKEYRAICVGSIMDAMTIDKPIARNRVNRKKMAIVTGGRISVTDILPLARYKGLGRTFTELRVVPHTGRTHQIRIHVKSIGHPVVGDPIYGGYAYEHLLLHAYNLKITVPEVGELSFIAPLPEYFNTFLLSLKKE